MDTHKETIKCPECDYIQHAEVEHTFPWYTRIHTCIKCNYLIFESEWNNVLICSVCGKEIETADHVHKDCKTTFTCVVD